VTLSSKPAPSIERRHVVKSVVLVAFACSCLVLPASAQQVVKQLLPTPPRGDKLEARLLTATIEPGAVGKWHTYPNHPVVYVVEGTVTVEFRASQ
jgi:quercetin dioxygenase-like cupin family protein